ncbi:LamG domain-containing protein [Neobacillus mesonae]|nr:LamG domain-containing protein [Neobacillus mesonae]
MEGNFGTGSVIGNNLNNPDGGSISYQEGVQGKAAVFDGRTGVRLPDGLISNDSYSVSMWVYADELPNENTTTFFGAFSNASWISLKPAGPSGNPMLWSGSAWYDAAADTALPLSEWTHLAFTVAGDQVKFYVNGEEKFTGTGFPDIFLNDNGTFSLAVNWWDIPFKGMMDELRIYRGAITAEEVAEIAEAPLQE